MHRSVRVFILALFILFVAVPVSLWAEGQEQSTPATTDDEVLKRRIVNQLVQDARVDAADIQVVVVDGSVTLEGTVPTYFARQEAYQIAWSIQGVKNVNNRLTVEYIPPVPDDEEIKRDAREVLRINPHIDEDEIDIRVQAGVLTLTGTVDSLWKKHRVEMLVSDVAGLTAVINSIAVVPTEKILDEVIARQIVAALERNADLEVDDIDVKVSNGQVTLSGSVDSYFARREAYELALYTVGVVSINDRLVVRPE